MDRSGKTHPGDNESPFFLENGSIYDFVHRKLQWEKSLAFSRLTGFCLIVIKDVGT